LATESPHNGLEPSNILAMLGAHTKGGIEKIPPNSPQFCNFFLSWQHPQGRGKKTKADTK
jgi:hypothetical protein